LQQRLLDQTIRHRRDAAGIVHLMQLGLGMIYEDGLR
jgi:hypothetical protein